MITIHINTTAVTVTLTPITTEPMIRKQSINSQYFETFLITYYFSNFQFAKCA